MLSDKQLLSIKDADGSVNIWEGAIRSSKTVASLLRWLIFVATAPPSGELVFVGRTRDSVWRNVIAVLQDAEVVGSEVSEQVVGNHGAPTVKLFGRRCYVMGASDVQAELVLRGLTVAGAYVDEITTIPELFFTQLLGRMSVKGAKLFGTTNPDGPRHWFKVKYLDRLDLMPHWRRWHFVMADNPGLTDEYKAQKELEFSGLWYRRFIKGEWVQAEGAVYDGWDDRSHVIDHDELPTDLVILSGGIDYGTTNATRGYLLGIGGTPTRLYVVDEWSPIKGTDAQLSQWYQDWQTDRPKPRWLAVDPAAASFKLQLFQDGVTNVVSAANAVLPGIRTISSLLAADKLKVSRRCKNLIKYLPGYMWDPKATARGEDAPIKLDDHEVDALRYAVYSSRHEWRGRIPLLIAEVDQPEDTAS